MGNERYSAVAFDIDGTLYPNGAMYRASLWLILRNWRLFSAFGRARREVRLHYPVKDVRAWTEEFTARELGLPREETGQLIQRIIYQQWEKNLLARVPLYSGVRELLEELRSRGVRTVAMSDFPVTSKLKGYGLSELFDLAFSSEEIGYLKPRREPFDHILEKLDVPAETVLYVGNSYPYDIIGAREVGMATAHIARRPHRESLADFTFTRYAQLGKWIVRDDIQ